MADSANRKLGQGIGDVRFVDTNQDGKISDDDAVMIGKPEPDWTYGFSFSCEYKGIDLSAFFQGVSGNQIFYAALRTDRSTYNKPSFYYTKGWSPTNNANKYPRPSIINQTNNAWSSLNVYDGDYLRLKNFIVGYTLPVSLSGKIGIKKLRFYASGTNLLTWTKYPGNDPEVGMSDPSVTSNSSNSRVNLSNQNSTNGVDRGLYPQAKTYTVGVNVTF
jgi:hypothetical protein